MSVAVGMVAGQPQGFWIVVAKVQSEKGHSLLQPRFWIVRVAVGQTASGAWARTRLARPRRAERASFILKAAFCGGNASADWRVWLWRSTVPGSPGNSVGLCEVDGTGGPGCASRRYLAQIDIFLSSKWTGTRVVICPSSRKPPSSISVSISGIDGRPRDDSLPGNPSPSPVSCLLYGPTG